MNPDSIVFRPGGAFDDRAVIGGSVGTISSHSTSLNLFNIFRTSIVGRFISIGDSYVGADAGRLLDEGWRLTDNVQAPERFDLKR